MNRTIGQFLDRILLQLQNRHYNHIFRNHFLQDSKNHFDNGHIFDPSRQAYIYKLPSFYRIEYLRMLPYNYKQCNPENM